MEDVDVDDEDVVIWDEPLVLANTFPSSAIEFFMSPRSCLIASVEEVVAEREADFEEEDVDRCVAEVSQAILLDDLVVLLLVDEDVLELLMLLVAFRSSCDELMLALESIVPVVVVDPAPAPEDDALELKKP